VAGGTALDLTGVGAVFGVPADALGIYQLTTGTARVVRGVDQFNNAVYNPILKKSPGDFFEDLVFNVVPGGNTFANHFGGLP
jgi:hypothetical protein